MRVSQGFAVADKSSGREPATHSWCAAPRNLGAIAADSERAGAIRSILKSIPVRRELDYSSCRVRLCAASDVCDGRKERFDVCCDYDGRPIAEAVAQHRHDVDRHVPTLYRTLGYFWRRELRPCAYADWSGRIRKYQMKADSNVSYSSQQKTNGPAARNIKSRPTVLVHPPVHPCRLLDTQHAPRWAPAHCGLTWVSLRSLCGLIVVSLRWSRRRMLDF